MWQNSCQPLFKLSKFIIILITGVSVDKMVLLLKSLRLVPL